MTEAEFGELATRIVNAEFAEQTAFWRIYQKPLLKELFDKGAITKQQDSSSDDFKFIGELQVALSVASNAAVLIAALAALYRVFKSTDPKDTTLSRLINSLQQVGIASDKAANIAKLAIGAA